MGLPLKNSTDSVSVSFKEEDPFRMKECVICLGLFKNYFYRTPNKITCSDSCKEKRKKQIIAKRRKLLAIRKSCIICLKIFSPIKNQLTCSDACSIIRANIKNKERSKRFRSSENYKPKPKKENIKNCVICDLPFSKSFYSVTCSEHCSKERYRIKNLERCKKFRLKNKQLFLKINNSINGAKIK